MDAHQLAVTVVAFLTPYLLKAGEEAAKSAGGAAWDKVTELYKAVSERFKKKKSAGAATTLKQYEEKPEENQPAMQKKLEEILERDAKFREQIAHLLSEAKQAGAHNTFITHFDKSSVRNYNQVGTNFGGITIKNAPEDE